MKFKDLKIGEKFLLSTDGVDATPIVKTNSFTNPKIIGIVGVFSYKYDILNCFHEDECYNRIVYEFVGDDRDIRRV